MIRYLFLTFLTIFYSSLVLSQQADLTKEIDSLITSNKAKPFNGVVLIVQDGQSIYSKSYGYSDLSKKIPLKLSDRFVIGSISKQITAILVLQEFQKGSIKLNATIRNYLPDLKASWADSVTIHQLLTHTHGITDLNKPLSFKPGTRFSYSQIGYQLLAQIIERTSGKSFATLSTKLFKKCDMKNTYYPYTDKQKEIVKCYTSQGNDSLHSEEKSFENFVPAGGFISTANDLLQWNNYLHGGKLLADSTYRLMITKQKNAIRMHPIFGITDYGYGITVSTKDSVLQLGQTGFTPGFVSMDFYYPESKTSIIVLDNVAWDTEDIKRTFYYHTQLLKIIKKSKLLRKVS